MEWSAFEIGEDFEEERDEGLNVLCGSVERRGSVSFKKTLMGQERREHSTYLAVEPTCLPWSALWRHGIRDLAYVGVSIVRMTDLL
jgi:hypothetical protein